MRKPTQSEIKKIYKVLIAESRNSFFPNPITFTEPEAAAITRISDALSALSYTPSTTSKHAWFSSEFQDRVQAEIRWMPGSLDGAAGHSLQVSLRSEMIDGLDADRRVRLSRELRQVLNG